MYKCVFSTDSSFIAGRLYVTDRAGRLIDENRQTRLHPGLYREHYAFVPYEGIEENE